MGARLERDEAVEYALELKEEQDLLQDIAHGVKPPTLTSKEREAHRRDELRSFGAPDGVLHQLRTVDSCKVSLNFLSNVFQSVGCLTILGSQCKLKCFCTLPTNFLTEHFACQKVLV